MNNVNNASGIKVPYLVAMPVTAHLLGSNVSCSANVSWFGKKKLPTW